MLKTLVVTGIILGVLFLNAYPRTEYAEGFSEARYRQIRAGMTVEEVRRILGEPLSTEPAPTWGRAPYVEWRYSRDRKGGPLDLGWWWRSLEVTNNIVEGKMDRFIFIPPWK